MNRRQIEVALWELTWKLRRQGISGPRRREIRRDLRANLYATAEDVGEQEALKRLGNLDALAMEYAETESGHPKELSIVGGIVWLFGTLIALALLNGRQLLSFNGLGERYDFDPWSWTLGTPNGKLVLIHLFGDVERNLLLQIEIHQLAYVVLPLLAFLIGLRPWRLLRRSSSSPGRREMSAG